MRRTSNRWTTALALGAAAAAFGTVTSSAAADRAPSRREASAIKRVALKACPPPTVSDCNVKRSRISTRGSRFAWADVIGEGLSGVLLKRPSARSRRFRIIGVQGGGVSSCSYWRARAPKSVLRDLHIGGVFDNSGATHNCG
jgi:hypothetical protein